MVSETREGYAIALDEAHLSKVEHPSDVRLEFRFSVLQKD